MFETEPYSENEFPHPNASEAEIDHQWRVWAAKEIQQRALLGNYILDGLITRMSGELGSIRHTASPLSLPSNEALFDATNSREWFAALRTHITPPIAYRTIFRSLFQPLPIHNPLTSHAYSAFSLRVVLEGLQSLVSDVSSDDMAIVGVPTKFELRHALRTLHAAISSSTHIPTPDRLELLLRWHAICLDCAVDTSLLCRSICARHRIPQYVWGGGPNMKTDLDLAGWASTQEARRALLHAVSIQEIVEQLPRGRAHVIHIPGSLFAAAAVYSVFSLAGLPTVSIPRIVEWDDVLGSSSRSRTISDDPCVILAELSTAQASETKRFVYGSPSAGRARTQQSLSPSHSDWGHAQGHWSNENDGRRDLNLFYELNSEYLLRLAPKCVSVALAECKFAERASEQQALV
jgi:hypothetical protein